MRRHPGDLLRGVAKFLGVVVAGVAIGAVLGFGLSLLAGDGNDSPEVSRAAAPSPSPTPTPSPTAPPSRTPEPRKPKPAPTADPGSATVTVLAVRFTPAQSASGKRRKRGRLSVRVSVKNNRKGPLKLGRPALMVGSSRTNADPRADILAGSVLKPIETTATAVGTLRFETAGAATDQLAAGASSTLKIAGRDVVLPPARP